MSATQYLSSGVTALALDEFAILKKAIKIIAKTLDMFLFFNKKILHPPPKAQKYETIISELI
jgi:hypothetical protein